VVAGGEGGWLTTKPTPAADHIPDIIWAFSTETNSQLLFSGGNCRSKIADATVQTCQNTITASWSYLI